MSSPHALYKDGQSVTPKLPVESIYALLERRAKLHPNAVALTYIDVDGEYGASKPASTYTNEELFSSALRIAHTLVHTYGFKPGDAVALNLHNSPEILLFHLAAWMSGCITVPLDLKRDDTDRKLYKLSTTGAKLLVTIEDKESKQEITQLQKKLPKLQVLSFSAKTGIMPKISKKKLEASHHTENPNDTALILFTSGTTALPKGVELSSANILYNADGIKTWLRMNEQDVFELLLPLHHINSTTFSIASLIAGASIVLVSRYTKSKFWEITARYGCTMSSIVPTICFDLLTEQQSFLKHKDNLKQFTRIQIGSAPVQPNDVLQFTRMYNIALVQGFGLTETALRISGFFPYAFNKEQVDSLLESNTIGSELEWNNLTVLRPDGTEADEKEEGELCARGPVIMKGYLDNPEATKKAFEFGWFHTGDLGYWIDAKGKKLFFTSGRSKEIIIKGGVNLSPLSIENAIVKQFPAISSCFAVPIPDKRYGEEVGVVITLQEGMNEDQKAMLMQSFQDCLNNNLIKGLSVYEKPSFVLVVQYEHLPKTSTGKVQRVVIRQYLQDIVEPVLETDHIVFRKITPFNADMIRQIVDIHNVRWGKSLGVDVATITKATEYGIVLAALSKTSQLIEGSVFALQLHKADCEKPAEFFKTYDDVTTNLTLKRHQPKGDAMLLVSISTQGEAFKTIKKVLPKFSEKKLRELLDEYLETERDPVLGFHMKKKGGLKRGAGVERILPGARVKDTEAMGFNVLMKYPKLSTKLELHAEESLGIQLIELAFIYAVSHGAPNVYAYSRPAGFRKWLANRAK